MQKPAVRYLRGNVSLCKDRIKISIKDFQNCFYSVTFQIFPNSWMVVEFAMVFNLRRLSLRILSYSTFLQRGELISYLLRLGITMFLGRMLLLLSKTNAENSQEISISCLYINVSLDQSLPFLDHGAKLIGSQVHAVELCQAVLSLNILTGQLELLVRPLSVLYENDNQILVIDL